MWRDVKGETHDICPMSSSSGMRSCSDAVRFARTMKVSKKHQPSRFVIPWRKGEVLTQDAHDVLSLANLARNCVVTPCECFLLRCEDLDRAIVHRFDDRTEFLHSRVRDERKQPPTERNASEFGQVRQQPSEERHLHQRRSVYEIGGLI